MPVYYDKCNFLDAVKQNKMYPTTFHIPDSKELKNLEVGDYAHLCFQSESGESNSERMWVEIIEVNWNHYIGVLRNMPLYLDYNMGDIFKFKKKHILNLMESGDVDCE